MARTPLANIMGKTAAVPGQAELGNTMRRLWIEQALWTRQYMMHALPSAESSDGEAVPIVTKGFGGASAKKEPLAAMASGPAQAALTRLRRNPEQIGETFAGYYGTQFGDALALILKAHVTIAVDRIAAARTGDKVKVASQDGLWTKNVDALAVFLGDANPKWSVTDLKELFHLHLELTRRQMAAWQAGQWSLDVELSDDITTHVLDVADELCVGITKQFVGRFPAAARHG